MAIVIDGSGSTVTFNASPITNVNTISFNYVGERTEIDLTGLGNTKFETAELSTLHKLKDIVVNVKNDPVLINALVLTKAVLVINLSDSATTTITMQAQFKGDSDSSVAAKARSDVDLTFLVTNLAVTTETGPVVAA